MNIYIVKFIQDGRFINTEVIATMKTLATMAL